MSLAELLKVDSKTKVRREYVFGRSFKFSGFDEISKVKLHTPELHISLV